MDTTEVKSETTEEKPADAATEEQVRAQFHFANWAVKTQYLLPQLWLLPVVEAMQKVISINSCRTTSETTSPNIL